MGAQLRQNPAELRPRPITSLVVHISEPPFVFFSRPSVDVFICVHCVVGYNHSCVPQFQLFVDRLIETRMVKVNLHHSLHFLAPRRIIDIFVKILNAPVQ